MQREMRVIFCEVLSTTGKSVQVAMPWWRLRKDEMEEAGAELWLYTRPYIFVHKTGGFTMVVPVKQISDGKPSFAMLHYPSTNVPQDESLRKLYSEQLNEEPSWIHDSINSEDGLRIIKQLGVVISTNLISTPWGCSCARRERTSNQSSPQTLSPPEVSGARLRRLPINHLHWAREFV